MKGSFSGLTTVNIELSNRCDKNCWMCGRRKIDREYPQIAMKYGDMDFGLASSIAKQLPDGIVVQLHNNGESLLYPRFGEAVKLFRRQIRCLDTNGKWILKKADEIIGNLDTLTVSVFKEDSEADEQYKLVKKFLKIKKGRKPFVVIRALGKVHLKRYEELKVLIVTRTLHSPMGSFKYKKRPTIPEIGICLDMLSHMVIRKDGMVSICVRFDPQGLGIIGDCTVAPLANIWSSSKRKEWLRYHTEGKRHKIPLCSFCEFWGVPTGY